MARISRVAAALLIAAWCVGVAVGLALVFRYSATPGAATVAPAAWPGDSAIAPARTGYTVVAFVHPECACSIASLRELGAAIGSEPARIAVVFEPVPGLDVTRSGAWSATDRVPGAIRVIDRGAAEAHRFGAQTSGFVVVYDASGRLRFSGGITGSRGHAGDNVGRRMVSAALHGARDEAHHDVFGCALEAAP